MKQAGINDKELVVKILMVSFKNDPHVNWLLEKSKNKDKFQIVMNYVFDETMSKGKIYLNEENNATALWIFKDTEKLTIDFFKRNINFLFKLGLGTTYRVLWSGVSTHREYAKIGPYCYLYLIGVLPEAQGKGAASALLNYMIEEMERIHKPIVLETSNALNVEIYRKKGFLTFKEMKMGNTPLYLMKKA